MHFFVDLCCVSLFFKSVLSNKEAIIVQNSLIISYNVFAFGLQAPLGFIADKLKISKEYIFIGCFLILSAFFLRHFPVAVIILIGIGNALFHVGAGSISLNYSKSSAKAVGIFVASGAAGLTLGTLIGKSQSSIAIPFLFFLILSIFSTIEAFPQISYSTKKFKLQKKLLQFQL